ncbi:prolyl-tRNA editing protein, partial [Enterococcus hirae]|nr:prolyl-tRNA editing protein [Enterococcus hirae]
APGRPDQTMVVKVADLDKIIQILEIKTYVLPAGV